MQRVLAAGEKGVVQLSEFSVSKSIPNIGTLANIILRNAFVIGGIVALFLLIFGGFGFIISAGSGDSKGMEKGQKAITAAVIGLILIVLSASLVTLIGKLIGQDLLGQ